MHRRLRLGITSCVKKVYTEVNMREQKNDFAYWQRQLYQARLATLE